MYTRPIGFAALVTFLVLLNPQLSLIVLVDVAALVLSILLVSKFVTIAGFHNIGSLTI